MNKLAQNFGQIVPPVSLPGANSGQILGNIIERIIQVLIVGAGLYALINFVIAGYDFMSAGDDSKKVAGAWAKIWQTILGLAFAAGAFVIAEIVSQVIFGQGFNILNPTITPLQ